MSAPDFTAASRVLADGVAAHAFPCAVAEVGRHTGVIWRHAVGRLHDAEDAPAASPETVFDLASLTKPMATTTTVMRLTERDRLRLDDRIERWLSAWRGADRAAVSVRDLLEHAAGLTAHLPFYNDCVGRSEFEPAICATPLEYEPRAQSVYSDLGFILLGFLVADAAGSGLDEHFEAMCADLGITEVTFRPPAAWRQRVAPTGFDKWRGRVLTGEVHDRNAWALGGVAGHAGLFGTAPAVGAFARAMLRAWRDDAGPHPLARPETVRMFARRSTVVGSSRTLGWDGMRPTSSCGALMDPTAIGHTGYTGTSMWIDAVHGVYVVLLTNRVHPHDRDQGILALRPRFHDCVMKALDAS
jgi:CubicO group peptidase (beta-lactamase class C family)